MNTSKPVINVRDETAPLELVAVGIGKSPGKCSGNNATVSQHFPVGQAFPEGLLTTETDSLCALLERHSAEVVRPDDITGITQIFMRDLGFVIGDKLFLGQLKNADRKKERQGFIDKIAEVLPGITPIAPPDDVAVEGGDIVLLDGRVFVGVGEDPAKRRTGPGAVDFLKEELSGWEVTEVTTRASDASGDDPRKHVLHLDCAFQPLGNGHAIIFEQGFPKEPEAILKIVERNRLIRVSGDEMYHLWPNLFSINPNTVVSSPAFTRLNAELRKTGLIVEEVEYSTVAKLGGLFRCSTLPLRRQ